MNPLEAYKQLMLELEAVNRKESPIVSAMDQAWARLTEDEKSEARKWSYVVNKLSDGDLAKALQLTKESGEGK